MVRTRQMYKQRETLYKSRSKSATISTNGSKLLRKKGEISASLEDELIIKMEAGGLKSSDTSKRVKGSQKESSLRSSYYFYEECVISTMEEGLRSAVRNTIEDSSDKRKPFQQQKSESHLHKEKRRQGTVKGKRSKSLDTSTTTTTKSYSLRSTKSNRNASHHSSHSTSASTSYGVRSSRYSAAAALNSSVRFKRTVEVHVYSKRSKPRNLIIDAWDTYEIQLKRPGKVLGRRPTNDTTSCKKQWK